MRNKRDRKCLKNRKRLKRRRIKRRIRNKKINRSRIRSIMRCRTN